MRWRKPQLQEFGLPNIRNGARERRQVKIEAIVKHADTMPYLLAHATIFMQNSTFSYKLLLYCGIW